MSENNIEMGAECPGFAGMAVTWWRFQKAMGNDAYAVEYASVGEIADAVVDLIVGASK